MILTCFASIPLSTEESLTGEEFGIQPAGDAHKRTHDLTMVNGGERRLNVLISRARERCIVFSSITFGDIPTEVKPGGTRMLREFLHFAETLAVAVPEA